jgi:hypothetical protein
MRRFSLVVAIALGVGVSAWSGVALAQSSSGHHNAAVERGRVRSAGQAIAIAERDPEIQGVKSSSAKRVTFGQVIATTGASVPGAATPSSATVWEVGIRARSVTPDFAEIPTHDDWAVVTIDQRSGLGVAFAAGPGELPGWYRNLP